jgi:hypothetical protein
LKWFPRVEPMKIASIDPGGRTLKYADRLLGVKVTTSV